MRALLVTLVVLLSCSSAADTLSGVKLQGAKIGAASGGGGGISGVEAACTTSGLYGSGGNCVGSETFQESAASVANDTSYDWPSSPDTHELWGNRTNAALFTSDAPGVSTVDITGSSGWGSATFALNHDNRTIWAQMPIGLLTSSTRTMCMRTYVQFDTTWTTDGSCRTKLFQWNYGTPKPMIQAESQSDGGSCTTSARQFDFWTNDAEAPLRYGTGKSTYDCDTKPCRIEMCIDGEVKAGVSIQARLRVTSFEGAGSTGTATSPVFTTASAMSDQSETGGDWWHSESGEFMKHAYTAVFAWDSDTDQWIGAACEIEGGC